MYSLLCKNNLFKLNIYKFTSLSKNLKLNYSIETEDDIKILKTPEYIKRKINRVPGIDKRKEHLQNLDGLENEHEEIDLGKLDPEEFNAMRMDFMGVHKSFDLNKREKIIQKKISEQAAIRKRHFKEPKEPALLTIAEMYQIKLLHNQDPQEWSPEILSQSYPASPSVIKKILKSNFIRSIDEMIAHDEKVKENWMLLQADNLGEISDEYKQHLQSFAPRDPIISSKEEYEKFLPTETKYKTEKTEFRDIITNYYSQISKKKKEKKNLLNNGSDTDNNDTHTELLTSDSNNFDEPNQKVTFDDIHNKMWKENISVNNMSFSNDDTNDNNFDIHNANNSFSMKKEVHQEFVDRFNDEENLEEKMNISLKENNNRKNINKSLNEEHQLNNDQLDKQDILFNKGDDIVDMEERNINDEQINHNNSNNETFDRNKVMYKHRPAHYIDYMRKNKIEKEKYTDFIKEDDYNYDGRWRRIKPKWEENKMRKISDERKVDETRSMQSYKNNNDEHSDTMRQYGKSNAFHEDEEEDWFDGSEQNMHKESKKYSLESQYNERELERTANDEFNEIIKDNKHKQIHGDIKINGSEQFNEDKFNEIITSSASSSDNTDFNRNKIMMKDTNRMENSDHVNELFDSEEIELQLRRHEETISLLEENNGDVKKKLIHSNLSAHHSSHDNVERKVGFHEDDIVLPEQQNNKKKIVFLDEDFMTRSNAKHYTLEALKDKLKSTSDLTSYEKSFLETPNDTNKSTFDNQPTRTDSSEKNNELFTGVISDVVNIKEKETQIVASCYIKEKITIPKSKYVKDALYKVEDCFYDCNGHFLYRVPGLKNIEIQE